MRLDLTLAHLEMRSTHAPSLTAMLANLAVISFEKLASDDDTENNKLLHACSTWGFFYLDFGPDRSRPYQSATSHLFDFAKQYFAQPLEDKMKDTNEDWEVFNLCGYKPRSLDTGNMQGK